ncbi:MAG TPA: TrmH family RNA methyltransferase, partial [Acidimicrobiales bacterium]|nr:TrmH family RNA methyltransferase [Acidimicrobiales bacterium]
RLDPELLAHGDRRNVADRYRYWRMEAIVADLDGRRHPFHVAVENWRHDLNIGAVVRNANAFLAAAVHVVGRKRWNRRGAMVTDRYQHIVHHPTVEGLVAWAETAGAEVEETPTPAAEARGERGLPIVGIDNLPGAVPLEVVALPRRCVLLFGQEGPGLSPAARRACSQVCSITMFGSTRSINAGVASGIAMHTWVRQHAL